jgi:SAM-dependent methyltransferase
MRPTRDFSDDVIDFRGQYSLPYHFLWQPNDLTGAEYEGYVRLVLDMLPPPPCDVLDVGCGDGCVASKVAERGYHVVGVDYSDRAIGFARLMVPSGEFLVCDVRNLYTLDDLQGRFPAAYCVEVIEHVPPEYQLDVLRQIHGCLQQDARLIVTVPSANMPPTKWHYKHFRREEMQDMLEEAGFRVETIVNQWVLSPLSHPQFWRVFRNKYWDLRVVRRVLSRVLLDRFNTHPDPRKTRRYVYAAVRL